MTGDKDNILKTIYIHIGMHKTGTSAIQNFLNDNKKNLVSQGVLYPESGMDGPTHGLLANSLKKANRDLNVKDLYYALKKEIEKYENAKVVISSECFMEGIDIENLKELLNQNGWILKIVIYLRRQDLWIESLYNEVVRDSMRRYTGKIPLMREVRQGKLNYYNELEKWSNVFGKKNIIVRPFEKSQLRQGLILDFIEVIGISPSENYYISSTKDAVNKSLDNWTVEFLRRCNVFVMKINKHKNLVKQLKDISEELELRKDFCPYNVLSKEERVKLLNECEQSNVKIANEYLNREDGKLFFENIDSDNYEETCIILPAKIQYEIISKLSKDIVSELEKSSQSVAKRDGVNDFMPVPFENEIDRLRAIIMRQSQELSILDRADA